MPLLVALFGIGGLGFGQRNGLVTHLTRAVPNACAPDLSGLITTSSPVAGAIGIAVFGTVYLRIAPGGDPRDAFAAVTAGFALVTLFSAIAAYLSIRRGAAAAEISAAAAARTG